MVNPIAIREECLWTIPGGSNSDTYTLASTVDPDYTVVFYDGQQIYSASTYDAAKNMGRIELTDGDTLTASTSGTIASSREFQAVVIEFDPTIVELVQSGTITIGASDADETATLGTAAPTDRSFVMWHGQTTASVANDHAGVCAWLQLTNSTTVTATRGTSSNANAITVGYSVVTLVDGIATSVQEVLGTIGAAGDEDSTTVTISTVDPDNCLVVFGGRGIVLTSSTDLRYRGNGILTDATTVTFSRGRTGTVDSTVVVTVIELASGLLQSNALHNTNTIATSATQADTTISTVDEDQCALTWLGESSTLFASNANSSTSTLLQTSDTNIQTERRTSSATGTVSTTWNLVEFVTDYTAPSPSTSNIVVWGSDGDIFNVIII